MASNRRSFDRIPAPFSDAVIGSVMTRSIAPGFRVTNPPSSGTPHSNSDTPLQHRQLQYTNVVLPPLRDLSPLATGAAEPTERFELKPTRLQGGAFQTRSFASRCRSQVSPPYPVSFHPTDSPARAVSAAVATLSIDQVEDEAQKQKRKRRAAVKTEACREQCRTNQARYRQKQREYVTGLESVVAQLRDEIPRLEVQRRRLRYDSQQRVWDVVVEYFELFRHGVGDAIEQGSASSSDILRASEAQQQLMFLRSTMAPDVEFCDVSGVEVLMEHWGRMSEYHENLEFELTHMEKVSESIVIAKAMLSVTVTKTTLECVFPHLMGSESVEDLSLAVRLLGHRLDYPCSVLFVWDEVTSLVVRLETDIDMVTPLQRLLGNLKDASRVLDGAVMTPQSYVDETELRPR
ncbi:hypothetical protein PRNP1_004356 [Phytophthora ramorum]